MTQLMLKAVTVPVENAYTFDRLAFLLETKKDMLSEKREKMGRADDAGRLKITMQYQTILAPIQAEIEALLLQAVTSA